MWKRTISHLLRDRPLIASTVDGLPWLEPLHKVRRCSLPQGDILPSTCDESKPIPAGAQLRTIELHKIGILARQEGSAAVFAKPIQ